MADGPLVRRIASSSWRNVEDRSSAVTTGTRGAVRYAVDDLPYVLAREREAVVRLRVECDVLRLVFEAGAGAAIESGSRAIRPANAAALAWQRTRSQDRPRVPAYCAIS